MMTPFATPAGLRLWLRSPLLLALCAALPACSTGSAEVGMSPKPVRGGVLRVAQQLAPHSLDPVDADSVYEALVVNQLYDGLLATDPGTGLRPALAESWTVSADGRTLTFELRASVRFHDGAPFRAEDVAFTLRRLLESRPRASIATPYLLAIEGAADFRAGRRGDVPGLQVLDPLRIRIQLERREAAFLEALTLDSARIVPRHLLETHPEGLARAPIGTGPFRFEAWEGNTIRLARNPDYHARAAYLDGVEISSLSPCDRSDGGVGRFLDGRLDVMTPSPSRALELDALEAAVLVRLPGLNLNMLGMQTGVPPLDNLQVRQAIAHAIDREALTATNRSLRRPANGIYPPGMAGYTPEPKTLPYDPERSRELLREAGYPGGAGLPPLTLTAFGQDGMIALAVDRLCTDLEAVGIPIQVRASSWIGFTDTVEAGAAPLFLLTWVADLSDEDPFVRSLFAPQGNANHFHFSDHEVTHTLARAAQEPWPPERSRLLREVERLVLEQAPAVPLSHTSLLVLMRPALRGLRFGTLGLASVELEEAWLHPGEPVLASLR